VIAIGLGDYLRAVQVLDAADDQALRRRVAEILGIEPRPVATSIPASTVTSRVGTEQPRTQIVVEDERGQDADTGRTGQQQPLDESNAEDVDVELISTAGTAPDLPMPQLAAPSGARPPLPHEPLFDPQRSRALIGAVLAATRAEGEIDEPALIERVASAAPVIAIPRRMRSTLALGVQVLVDLCPSMLPFRRDQDDLLLRIDRLVTDGLLDVQTFEGDPTRIWSARRRGMRAYEPPRPGTPVLALTDLGLRDAWAGRSDVAVGWLAFAARLARAQVPFAALVPYPPATLPRSLVDRIAVVQWDRPTSVSSVQRAAARARRAMR